MSAAAFGLGFLLQRPRGRLACRPRRSWTSSKEGANLMRSCSSAWRSPTDARATRFWVWRALRRSGDRRVGRFRDFALCGGCRTERALPPALFPRASHGRRRLVKLGKDSWVNEMDLLPNEAILKRDSNVSHGQGGIFDSREGELVLTNFALVFLRKGAFGGVKDITRFPLDQVKVVNGIPQIAYDKPSGNDRQLRIHFAHGVESFSLGQSDDDEDSPSLKDLFTSTAEKERRNAIEWRDAVTRVVLSLRSTMAAPLLQPMAGQCPPPMQGQGGAVAGVSSGQRPSEPSVPRITRKCVGCMAPITGVQGERVFCRYCDTEQAI